MIRFERIARMEANNARMYLYIEKHMNQHGYFPSVEKMVAGLDLSARSVRRTLKAMHDAGLIVRDLRGNFTSLHELKV